MAELRLLFRYPKGRIFNDNDFELVPAPVPIAVDEYPAFLGLRQQVWLPPKQAFVDDKILPTWSGGLDEYNAFIPQLQSLWLAKQPQVDEDAGITLATFALEDGELWVARFQQQYTLRQLVNDEDGLPISTVIVDDEQLWIARRQTVWNAGQPLTDEDVPTFWFGGLDDDLQWIGIKQLVWNPVQPPTDEDAFSFTPPLSIDDALEWYPLRQLPFLLPKVAFSDDDHWVPFVSSPNKHRLVIDIESGRLGWIVSGTHTGNPIVIRFF